jgi:hypothetical protein
MKKNKLFLLLILPIIFLNSCSSNDEEPIIPVEHIVEITLDFNALANLEGNDATALASFGNGVSAADFTTDAIIGDKITYKIIASSNIEVICTDYLYASGDEDLWSTGLQKLDNGAGMVLGLEVLAPATLNQECKFNILFRISTDGVEDVKEYIIDPKIRIKTKR